MVIHAIFQVIYLLVIVHVVLSWLPVRRSHPAVLLLHNLVDPLLRPFRRLVPPWRTGGLDLSPIVLIAVLWVIEMVVVRVIPRPAVP